MLLKLHASGQQGGLVKGSLQTHVRPGDDQCGHDSNDTERVAQLRFAFNIARPIQCAFMTRIEFCA